ncbi:hypothetical protein M8C21_009320 [Ambrosia artemisiifolia]|uniref:Protein kinase domain-containing protein n=1 Tax=Ambrosia artemisiifolia TaxID=4212 RepID=A0AAD5DDL3_AMBAR|nr:hypothetical protein M8C21_009320 [Ambrosia artemisiifolia]
MPIAVKELHPYMRFDVNVLKYFHHPNIVKPIGYCLEGAQIFLVYEFMSNGMSMDLTNRELPLVTKVKIVVGIARGLVFLHKTLSKKIMPRFSESPLYRHNIFLDKDYTAKLSDYDVSIFVGIPPRIPNICIDGCIELLTNPTFYGVVFLEVLTRHQIIYLDKLRMIESFFIHYGKESLLHISKLCFEICNEVDSESKMLTTLEEYDKLIRERLSDWLRDTKSMDRLSVKF